MKCERIIRLLHLFVILSSGARVNSYHLASELERSRRTILRDLSLLKDAGIPIYYDVNRESYCIRSSYRTAAPALHPNELIALLNSIRIPGGGIRPGSDLHLAISKILGKATTSTRLMGEQLLQRREERCHKNRAV